MRDYKYRIWDKQSDLLGRGAKEWMELHPHLHNGKVFVVSINDIDRHVENLDSTRLTLDVSGSDEEVMQQYVDNLINEREQEPLYVHKNAELKTELFQAKLTLMKEGLI